ncbi:hypothetical protein R3W88_003879 [Solanum pinnatisectum]|uniref:Uncharacterized protein n=1 Tax=Solanum pinnatisectum TaxID=50273 RepID=A0AAV9MQL4_9SOLN|nr:hypothetical protein R3W88_003879 [Solanum pinnatisectum]
MAFKKINEISCKDSTSATFVDFSDVYPITRCEFNTSALNEFEYLTSLEMARKSKGNIASKLFDELSHFGSNFSESKNSTDSSISTKVNSLMVDATYMDEKFTMMEQTIEALKKSIDNKNLQIAELMSKLDLYNSRKSHHILTAQEKFDIDSPTKPVDSQSAKRSASVATLTVQQLQNMITNTIKAQYGGPPQKYPFPDYDVLAILNKLLTKKVIVLPKSKRPKESNKVDYPMYFKFHRIIGHHTTKCFILKEKIMTLVREGKIIIDDGETAETNHAKVLRLVASPKIEKDVIILQFGSIEPIKVSALKKTTNTSKVDDFSNKKNDDTWILVKAKTSRDC